MSIKFVQIFYNFIFIRSWLAWGIFGCIIYLILLLGAFFSACEGICIGKLLTITNIGGIIIGVIINFISYLFNFQLFDSNSYTQIVFLIFIIFFNFLIYFLIGAIFGKLIDKIKKL